MEASCSMTIQAITEHNAGNYVGVYSKHLTESLNPRPCDASLTALPAASADSAAAVPAVTGAAPKNHMSCSQYGEYIGI